MPDTRPVIAIPFPFLPVRLVFAMPIAPKMIPKTPKPKISNPKIPQHMAAIERPSVPSAEGSVPKNERFRDCEKLREHI